MSKKYPTVIDQLQRPDVTLPPILKGEVVNVNDPQQEGRILVFFPILGGKFGKSTTNTTVDHFKWIPYAPMFAGVGTDDMLRGPATTGQDSSSAGVKSPGKAAYGWWAIPRVGSTVFCFIANGDPNDIHWFACKYPTKAASTLFGGKFTNSNGIDGPFTENNSPLEPVYSNQTAAFGQRSGNYEWLSRMADYNPSRVSQDDISANLHPSNKNTSSPTSDDVNQIITENDGSQVGRFMKYTPGYALSRSNPTLDTTTPHDMERLRNTEQNSESTMFGFSTPAGHYVSFDDRPENCRTKIRSATGHTILMDDTNDRIYVSTNKGNSYFEMDSNGHVYFHASESISFNAGGHINMTAGKTVRFFAKEGIHFVSKTGDIRMDCDTLDVSSINYRQQCTGYNLSVTDYKLTSTNYSVNGNSVNIKSGGELNVQAGSKLSLKASGVVAIDGSGIALDGGQSSSAQTQTPDSPELAWWTNITPQHEPWARSFNGSKDVDELFNHTPEFGYDDAGVNRDMNQVIEYDRGDLWRR